jgi:Thioredoxin
MSSSVEGSEEDLTRKQRREQARANRKAMEEAEAAGAARRKRLAQLGIVIGIVVAVVVGIVIATGGSSKKGIPTNRKEANQNVTAVTQLLQGIPQSGNTLGDPKAPVTLQYFGDLECPVCQQFTLGALPAIIQKYVKTGKARIARWRQQRGNRKHSGPSRWRRSPRASRSTCGTTSSCSTASRAKRAADT